MEENQIKDENSTGVKMPVMPCCIKYEDLSRCFDTLFKLAENDIDTFSRDNYIKYAIMINENIAMEKVLNKA